MTREEKNKLWYLNLRMVKLWEEIKTVSGKDNDRLISLNRKYNDTLKETIQLQEFVEVEAVLGL